MVEEEEKQEAKPDMGTSERTSLTNKETGAKSIDKLPSTSGNSIWAANGLEKLKIKKTPKIHKR